MKVKMILPALAEATTLHKHSLKYSLFPPLGLATLAGYLRDDDEVVLQDEHVETLDLDDVPDLVVIQVYISSAYRAYALADHYRHKGAHVCLGGVHVTSLPEEAAQHADTIFLGPGEDTWPAFLEDFRAGQPGAVYRSTVRTLHGQPPARRDLIKRQLYLMPNTLAVSRGCPHACDFCYKASFYRGGRSFYTQRVEEALAEIERLPGNHLYFVDDHFFGDKRFVRELFAGMRGMGRVWQAAGTVAAALEPGLLEEAVDCGLRSLFIGFETLSAANLRAQGKGHNLNRDYAAAIRRLHSMGVMVNASFVFGMDEDDPSVFQRTVDWAVTQGIETATFHILTPFPGTALHARMTAEGRVTSMDWDRYDTRHVVFQPANMTAEELERGYWQAYRDFYAWGSILNSACAKPELSARLRHLAYTGAWKKCDPLWNLIVQAGMLGKVTPLLEGVLGGRGSLGRYSASCRAAMTRPGSAGILPAGS